jgi:phospholipase/lecithinase/hemolysin
MGLAGLVGADGFCGKNGRPLLSILAIILGLFAPSCFRPASAAAATPGLIERLYVFGDSYSDSGNGYALTKTPPSPPYGSRFSNGMTAAEYMAQAFGVALRFSENPDAPADASLNFAVSGAWTSHKNNDATIDGRTGLLNQIAWFEQRLKAGKARFDPDSTLFFIAIGTNDVLFGNIAGLDNRTLVADAMRNMETAVRFLHLTGARHIAVATIPSVNLTPRAASLPPATARAVGEAVLSLNEGYRALAIRLRTQLAADVFVLPWGGYYDELMTNPSAFGLANAGSCIARASGAATVCPDPQRFIFWDALHPTTAAHRVVGNRVATQSRPHFGCPEGVQTGAATEQPACRFLSAGNGMLAATPSGLASPQGQPRDARTCTRVAFRQTADMCNNCTAPPWNGDIRKVAGEEWALAYVDGRNRSGTVRWRLKTQNDSEIVFRDAKRDLYTRFDLTARKAFQRRGGAGSWLSVGDILETDCR